MCKAYKCKTAQAEIPDSWLLTDLLLLLVGFVGRAAVRGRGRGFERCGGMRGRGTAAARRLTAQRVRGSSFLLLVLLWVLKCCEQQRQKNSTKIRSSQSMHLPLEYINMCLRSLLMTSSNVLNDEWSSKKASKIHSIQFCFEIIRLLQTQT